MADFIQQLTSNLVVAGLTVFAISLGFFSIGYLHKRRQLLHQERMASLVKGLHYAGVAREVFSKPKSDSRDHLLRGLRWLLGGAGVSGTLYGTEALGSGDMKSAIIGALVGLIPAAIGIAHLIFCFFTRQKKNGTALPLPKIPGLPVPGLPGIPVPGIPNILRIPGLPGVVYRASHRRFFGR